MIGIKHASAINHTINQIDNPGAKSSLQYRIQNIEFNRIGNKVEVNYIHEQKQASVYPGFSFFYRSPNRGGLNPDKNIYEDDF